MGSANSLKLKVTKPLGVPHDVYLAGEREGWGTSEQPVTTGTSKWTDEHNHSSEQDPN